MMLTIISVIILIFSVIIHEVSHGYMADRLGDPTPRMQGRLTLNPLAHLDPVGSIIVPIITTMFGFSFGWAKPVVYNPYNLKNKRQGEFLIAIAGPLSNLFLAVVFGLITRLSAKGATEFTPALEALSVIVLINIVLAVFNLIPLPPLDGSKLLFSILPRQYGGFRMMLEQYAPMFIIIVVFFLWKVVSPVVPLLFSFLTGL
jgi:Zn-dependent protease